MRVKIFKIMVIAIVILSAVIPSIKVHADTTVAPFSVLLLGIDTGALGREEQGRSDVIMIMTVHPKEQQISLTSIPRDTFVSVPELDFQDKLNHAYAYGGSDLSLKVVNAWLDSNVRYYMQVDFAGIEHIVDAVGGIDVLPPASFEIDGFVFTEGEKTHLDGETALAYARERYTSGGDYARQNRQREILQAIIQQLNQMGMAEKVQQLLPTLLTHIRTNLNALDILNLYQTQKNNNFTLETYQLEGEGTMMDGVYYDMPNEESVEKLKRLLTSGE